MRIIDLRAYPTSHPVPPEDSMTMGIGRLVKRDAVIVKVTAEDGLVGYGESHHGRSPGTVAHLVNTTLSQLVIGMDALDVVGVWSRIYKMQLGSHGMGAGTAIAMSGIDMALWDIRGKATGWPLYRLLGGASRPVPAYAGGPSLGYQSPETLVETGYMAATIHFLASIDNGGYFEAEVSRNNPFRDRLVSAPYTLDDGGCVCPLERPGIGVEVDEQFLIEHPVIDGPGYV